jgi:hypothetical protein
MALPGDSTGSRQGPRVPSVGKPPVRERGRGPLQHLAMWWGQRRQLQRRRWCRGWVTVAPATTMTAAAAIQAGNRVQQGQEHLSEFPRRHLTGALDLHFNLFVRT